MDEEISKIIVYPPEKERTNCNRESRIEKGDRGINRKRNSRSRSFKGSHSKRRRSKSRSHKRSRSRRHRSMKRPTSKRKSVSRNRIGDMAEEYKRRENSVIKRRRPTPDRRILDQLTEEEKDARTIYIWQLSLRVRTRDLENFFTSVGKMDVVRLVLDNKTGKSRGVAFIQFRDIESVNKALDLNGQKLLGVPIQVRTVSSEKCRAAEGTLNSGYMYFRGPTKLCISNLHTQITEQMLEEIFCPYGKIDELRLMKDVKGQSLCTAFIMFRKGEHAKNVIEQMNDFNLAGQLLKITPVIEEGGLNELGENQGVSMTASDRLGLMAKLAVGTGLQITITPSVSQEPIINSQCFVLLNMFDSTDVNEDKFCKDVQDDVVGECNQFGGIYHIYIDKMSLKGEVYVKCPSIYVANKCVSTLHGRSFDGRLITANYISLENYHKMFPDSISVKKLIRIED